MRLIAAAAGLLFALPAGAIELHIPAECVLGETCIIQQYVDHNPGPEAKDYRCGTLVYNGHKGTDFRLPTLAAMQAGVKVLAAAPGRVLRVRDGMADRSFRAPGGSSVDGAECGNGLVIAHDEGYETQYCHLRKGSILVRPGDRVGAGQALGLIGLSGKTEFPHVHLTVRRDGKVVDPFAVDVKPGACGQGTSIWSSDSKNLAYRAGEVLNSGFAGAPVNAEQVEQASAAEPTRSSPALLAYVRAIGLRKDDVQRLVVSGPTGTMADSGPRRLDANKAQYLLYVGRKRHAQPWPAGTYVATYSVIRGRSEAIQKSFQVELK
jgi:hypothetical protein